MRFDESSDEDVMRAFSAEVTRSDTAEEIQHYRGTPIFIGWCLANEVPVERAERIESELRYQHHYDFD